MAELFLCPENTDLSKKFWPLIGILTLYCGRTLVLKSSGFLRESIGDKIMEENDLNVNKIDGTDKPNNLKGTDNRDWISAYGGNDIVHSKRWGHF